MNFQPFKLAIQKQFERLSKHQLFRADMYNFVYFNTLHDAKVWCETVTKMERS